MFLYKMENKDYTYSFNLLFSLSDHLSISITWIHISIWSDSSGLFIVCSHYLFSWTTESHKAQEIGNHPNFPIYDESFQLLQNTLLGKLILLQKYIAWQSLSSHLNNIASHQICVVVHIKIYFSFLHFSCLSTVNIKDRILQMIKREKQACKIKWMIWTTFPSHLQCQKKVYNQCQRQYLWSIETLFVPYTDQKQ